MSRLFKSSDTSNRLWWHNAVVYQVYPRSFKDSNGDGIGDLPGILSKLEYFEELGIDAIWLSPFYKSPMKDFGYDVSDYCSVDSIFGDLADFDSVLKACHAKNIKVIIDLVPNHTSNEHPWFCEAVSCADNARRDWYIFRSPAADGGPPNNWQSYFGGSAWTLDEPSKQYYLHQFLPEQPELNYENPQVLKAILEVIEFWLKRGVDGFRVDVIWLLAKDPRFLDEPENPDFKEGMIDRFRHLHIYTEDLPKTHEYIREFRRLLDAYTRPGAEKVMIGEIYLPDEKLVTYYGTADKPECHLPFNFRLMTELLPEWTARNALHVISRYLECLPPGQVANWVLGNHDNHRVVSRISPAAAGGAMLLLLSLPGSPTLYYGDELGLPDGIIPPAKMVDPQGWRQLNIADISRDPERTPMQWNCDAYAGFSDVEPWLPVQDNYRTINVEVESRLSDSMLCLTKTLLKLRKTLPGLLDLSICQLRCVGELFCFIRGVGEDQLLVVLNFGAQAIEFDVKDFTDKQFSRIVLTSIMDGGVLLSDSLYLLRPFEGIILAAI